MNIVRVTSDDDPLTKWKRIINDLFFLYLYRLFYHTLSVTENERKFLALSLFIIIYCIDICTLLSVRS